MALFSVSSVPAPLPAYLSQGPPVLVDPGRVVPLSDSQKFERHYQPNVALAPPKVRDKAARVSLKDLSTAHLSQDAHEKIAIYMVSFHGSFALCSSITSHPVNLFFIGDYSV